MYTVKSILGAALAAILCLFTVVSCTTIPVIDSLKLGTASGKDDTVEFQTEVQVVGRDSAIKKVDLTFCRGLDLDDHECFKQSLELTNNPSECYGMPAGFLGKGQSMWLSGFRCRIYTNDSCKEGTDWIPGWFTTWAKISEDTNEVWQTYQCKLSD